MALSQNKEELTKELDGCFNMAEKMMTDTGEVPPLFQIGFINEKGEEEIIPLILATGDNRDLRDKFISAKDKKTLYSTHKILR